MHDSSKFDQCLSLLRSFHELYEYFKLPSCWLGELSKFWYLSHTLSMEVKKNTRTREFNQKMPLKVHEIDSLPWCPCGNLRFQTQCFLIFGQMLSKLPVILQYYTEKTTLCPHFE